MFFPPQIVTHVADVTEEVSGSDETTRVLKIPAGTPLAYNMCELLVHPDGSMELILDKDNKGGFLSSSGGGTTMCAMAFGIGHDVMDGPYSTGKINYL